MKGKFLSVSILLLTSMSSYCGDVGIVNNFNGFYIGSSLGGNFSLASISQSQNYSFLLTSGDLVLFDGQSTIVQTNGTLHRNSVIGTLFGGYGKVWNNYYLGAEIFGDLSQYKMNNSISNVDTVINNVFFPLASIVTSNTNNLSTQFKLSPVQGGIDLRPGLLITRDFLLYGRVGVKFAKISWISSINHQPSFTLVTDGEPETFPNPIVDAIQQQNKNVSALRLGAGMEYAVNPSWSIRMDYIYTDYGKIRKTFNTTNFTTDGFFVNTLNYNLNSTIKNIRTNAVMMGISYYPQFAIF